jgi:hypothetical protein
MIGRLGLGLFIGTFLLTGCASKFPGVNTTLDAPGQAYKVPPKQLVTTIKEIVTAPPLSLGVTEEKDGSILTGYQEFPGNWHIGRRWQERTRYRVTVNPDWNEPTAAARIEVRELTEQRAASNQTWKPAFDLQRPDRAKELLAKLDEQIRSRAPTK